MSFVFIDFLGDQMNALGAQNKLILDEMHCMERFYRSIEKMAAVEGVH